jgi:hypothetical protein
MLPYFRALMRYVRVVIPACLGDIFRMRGKKVLLYARETRAKEIQHAVNGLDCS